MKIKINEKNSNKLLDRLEVEFEIEIDGATPKRIEVKDKLAAMINYDSSLVIITKINQQSGIHLCKGYAHAYKSQEVLQRVEPSHLIKRNMPPAKSEES